MRSFPIFRACVRTCRYRDSRAATPTARRSELPPVTGACNIAGIVPEGSGSTGRLQLAQQRCLVDVVDEGALSVDFDHGQPLAIPGLERRVACDVDPLMNHAEPCQL